MENIVSALWRDKQLIHLRPSFFLGEEKCPNKHVTYALNDLIFCFSSVSARQAYMKGVLTQSSDTQYWDIWNRQNLSPEFEAKRQNILKANQVLLSNSSAFEILMN